MFLAQNHPIRQGKSKPSRWRGRRLCRRRGASWVPPRGGAAEVRHCPVPVRCSGWGSVPGSAAPGPLVSRQALVCGAGRRSPRTGGPQEGVLAAARVAAAQLSPSVLVANARRLGVVRLHVKHGVCLMRFLDCADGKRRRMQCCVGQCSMKQCTAACSAKWDQGGSDRFSTARNFM